MTPEDTPGVVLSFSAGRREGEALQAEETGQWSLLRDEENLLRKAAGVGGTLLPGGRRPLRASRRTVQEGPTSCEPNASPLIVSMPSLPLRFPVRHRVPLSFSVNGNSSPPHLDGGAADSRPVLQHGGPMGDRPQIHPAAAEARSRSVRGGVRGPVERNHRSRSEDPQTRYAIASVVCARCSTGLEPQSYRESSHRSDSETRRNTSSPGTTFGRQPHC